MLKELKKNYFGRVIISVIIGLGLSALFRKVCNDRECLVIKGPNIEEVENSIFNFDGKCYKYKALSTSCKK